VDIATLYRDVMFVQSRTQGALINQEFAADISKMAERIPAAKTISKIDAIMSARTNLNRNAAPLLTLEALMCQLAQA
jgi:DNA polymerase-3 subunit delta'